MDLAERVDVSPQAVSQHFKLLENAGLVEARREGTRHIYAVRPGGGVPGEPFVRQFSEEKSVNLQPATEG